LAALRISRRPADVEGACVLRRQAIAGLFKPAAMGYERAEKFRWRKGFSTIAHTGAWREIPMNARRTALAAAFVAVGITAFAAGTVAQGRYPLINQAEGALNAALGDLARGRDVFGGHKQNAAGLIQQAIGELEAGKQFAYAHGY
jgi:hypothetical protein